MVTLTLHQARSISALCTDHQIDTVTIDRPLPRRSEVRATGRRNNQHEFTAIVDTDGHAQTIAMVAA